MVSGVLRATSGTMVNSRKDGEYDRWNKGTDDYGALDAAPVTAFTCS